MKTKRFLPLTTLSLSALVTSCLHDAPLPFVAEKKVDLSSSEAAPEVVVTPDQFPSLNIIPGKLPDPAREFLPVTEKIFATLKEVPEGDLQPYTETVPKAGGATFEMVPIPGGSFTMGTPDGEAQRKDDEGPQRAINIEPFWMASTEVTWGLYLAFMENGKKRNKDGSLDLDGNAYTFEPPLRSNPELIDAISQPTPPYLPMHNNMANSVGYDAKYPAIAPTQHAASKFCEWLTAQTGHFYRLPTEAEWEYACRAGTITAYFFGDNPADLDDYAWHLDNANDSYQPVGQKKPNPWGLYDIIGNVREWTIDAYLPDYTQHPDNSTNPFALSPKRYPRVTRGGDWDSDPDQLRSGSRRPSSKAWKDLDPQEPKSIWYHTNAWALGFRIVRPGKNPTLEEMHLLWNTGPGERF